MITPEQMTASTTERWMCSGWLYWVAQVGGWGGMALLNISALAQVGKNNPAMITGFLVASTVALLGTHVLQLVMRGRGWLRLGLWPLGLRLLGMCVLIASVVVVVAVGLEKLAFPTATHPSLALPSFVRLVLYWTIAIAFWSVFYLLFYFFREARIAERDRWRLEAAVRQGELELLKSQLDPHFMFNSLNSIRSLILEHPGKARDMVTRLAGILRYSLRSSRAQTVTLNTELQTLRSYLDLEAVRLEERLHCRIDVEEDARNALVPPMILQMLVENGIKHGVSTLVEGGEIAVSAKARNGNLELRVENSGRLGTADGNGVGLHNARERLRLLYGDAAALGLEQEASRVVATVCLPLETAGEDATD